MDSSLVEGGLNVTLTIRLLMHGKVSAATWNCYSNVFKQCLFLLIFLINILLFAGGWKHHWQGELPLCPNWSLSFLVFIFVKCFWYFFTERRECQEDERGGRMSFLCLVVQIWVIKMAVTHRSQQRLQLIWYFLFLVSAERRSHQHLRGELSREDHNSCRADHLYFQGLLHDHWEARGGWIFCC